VTRRRNSTDDLLNSQTASPAKSVSPTGAGNHTPTPTLIVRDLEYRYGDRKALAGVSFTVNEGEIFGFLGPNGSGKTTLFTVLSTLRRPFAGSVTVCGHDLRTAGSAVRGHLGVAFQSPSVDGKLTCAENLRHHGHLYGIVGADLKARVTRLLARFDLADREKDPAEQLSGGMRRRLELAKAILHRPRLLILDEPATGLDPAARQEMWQDLKRLQADDGVTVVLTTHLMEEGDRCDRLAIMSEGRIVATGTPAALKSEIGGDVIQIESQDPLSLARRIEAQFGVKVIPVGDQLQIEHATAHRFVAELIEAFPGSVEAVRVARPSLDDVFLHTTGHAFRDEEARPS
jgi:ABC-2 type transport system ATP-binding protein